jgi:hypothetical protein
MANVPDRASFFKNLTGYELNEFLRRTRSPGYLRD